ncbi:MAG: hypothetical protein A2516_00320 [Alphaproteobacteria bacterium RIFOXYD12_FULL_60_8]|nr:MAG: hypothetical protein A2516_00320 [Alphaproteobacteria bacterium RIFOXYD12_FULL_60_8]
MILFFHTETTGLPINTALLTIPASLVSCSSQRCFARMTGRKRATLNLVVNPGIPIPEEASRIHRITDDVAARCGVSPKAAGVAFLAMIERAGIIAAHNIGFDLMMIKILARREGLEISAAPEHFCTMKASTPVLNLPPTDRMKAAGFNKPKSPRLEEAYRHFFGNDLEGAHDAMVDVRACRDVYFKLKEGGSL